MNDPQSRRKLIILVSAVDAVISSGILLIYFGLFTIDISSWNIPRWVIGLVGGVWFAISIGILSYQLTRTDISE